MNLQKYKNKIEKFNKELREYYKVSGDNELPDIETTVIGTSPCDPYEIEDIENGFICHTCDFDYKVTVEVDEDGEEHLDGWNNSYDSLKDCIDYDRRRLRKAWRVFKSENPDVELEKDEE